MVYIYFFLSFYWPPDQSLCLLHLPHEVHIHIVKISLSLPHAEASKLSQPLYVRCFNALNMSDLQLDPLQYIHMFLAVSFALESWLSLMQCVFWTPNHPNDHLSAYG